MNVNAVGAAHVQRKAMADVRLESRELKVADKQTPESAQPETAAPDRVIDGSDGEKGVIRHLLSGHFKGVADVRLRINFHEELSQIEQAARTSSVDGHLERFVSLVSTPDFVSVMDPEAAAEIHAGVAEFANSAEAAFSDFLAPDVDSPQTSLVSSLQAALDAYVASLEEAIAVPEDSGVTGDAAEVNREAATAVAAADVPAEDSESTEEAAAVDLTQYIAELTASFDAALADLELALQSAAILPPLSEPTGNGVAYQKFLAIYEALRGGPPAVESEAAPETNIVA